MKLLPVATFSLLLFFTSCKGTLTQKEDDLYSRHLQRHVKLTIISTPLPEDKSDLNLIMLNDGQDLETLGVKRILDSLWKLKAVKPCVIVGIHAGDRMQEYGVAGQPDYLKRGSKAEDYGEFINNELYPYAKKMCETRKFKSVTIGGWSLGGLSAFDVAWTYADKIDKVGVFSGSFWWRNKDAADSSYSDSKNRIMLNKLNASRKKPSLQYWFVTGKNEEKDDRDKDGIPDVIDDTRDVVEFIKLKRLGPGSSISAKETQDGRHDLESWAKLFPEFLVWAAN